MADTVHIVQVDPSGPDTVIIQQAADVLKQGGLVVFPTETVYGVGALFGDNKAVDRLYNVKQRGRNKPFTIHISSMDKIHGFGCIITQTASILMRTYWPGPLTLLLPIAGKKAKLGFRLPDHPVALALIEAAGGAVLAPSANKSGAESPVTAQQACEQIGTEVDLILDGGQTGWGKDSTIVDLSGDEMVICRQGALSKAEILKSIQIRG